MGSAGDLRRVTQPGAEASAMVALRRRKRLVPVLAALLIAALAAAHGAQTANASPGRHCGEVAVVGESGAALVSVSSIRIGCRTARAVLLRQRRAGTRGWSCHSSDLEATCKKGGASAAFRPALARDCGNVGFSPNSEDGAFGITEKHTNCRTARSVARRSREHDLGGTHRFRARGFRCLGRVVSGAFPMLLYTCRKAEGIVAFERP